MRLDAAIHQRLGGERLVLLVVAVATIAHQVDEDVLVEGIAVIDRGLHGEGHRFGVVAVDVQHRRLDHLGDVGAVQGRAHVARVGGGETDLVVDHHMDRAAIPEAARLRHVEAFHHHALPRQRGVAMQDHRHHFVAKDVATAVLTCPHRATHHRMHDFEMGGIERQGQMHRAIRRGDVGGKTLMVFDVTRQRRIRVAVARLFVQGLERTSHDVGQHVDAPAMRHAHHDFLGAVARAARDHLVEQRNQALAAFERKALLSNMSRMQEFFQRLGVGQPFEQLLFQVGCHSEAPLRRLDAFLQPAFARHIGDVHVFDANMAAIRAVQALQDIGQRGALHPEQRAGLEFARQIGLGQAIVRRVKFGGRGRFKTP